MKADLHCHSQYSYDSIAKIEEIIKEAETKGLDAVAITDHDNARAWKEIKKQISNYPGRGNKNKQRRCSGAIP